MTKPHTTLSEAVRAMNRAKLLPVWDDINHKLHAELDIIFKALDAAALVERHEAQEPKLPIDLSHHLRETADQQPGWKPLLTAAADEIERYYGGMMAWKRTAEAQSAVKEAQEPVAVNWQVAELISSEDHVDEALRAFSEDPTGDNGVGVILAALTVYAADAKAAQPTLAATQAGDAWQPIETAPKDKSVMLYAGELVPFYVGRKRYGVSGEPQQDVLAWRCDSSGRFVANPTHWRPIPSAPTTTRSE